MTWHWNLLKNSEEPVNRRSVTANKVLWIWPSLTSPVTQTWSIQRKRPVYQDQWLRMIGGTTTAEVPDDNIKAVIEPTQQQPVWETSPLAPEVATRPLPGRTWLLPVCRNSSSRRLCLRHHEGGEVTNWMGTAPLWSTLALACWATGPVFLRSSCLKSKFTVLDFTDNFPLSWMLT